MYENTPNQDATWTCSCGKTGNLGNFCPNCGMPKPSEIPTAIDGARPRAASEPVDPNKPLAPEDILWVNLPQDWSLQTAELDYNQPSLAAPFRVRADAGGGHAYVYWLERALWQEEAPSADGKPEQLGPTQAWMREQSQAPWMCAEDYVDWLAREYAEDCDAKAVFLEERSLPKAGLLERAELERELAQEARAEHNRFRMGTGVTLRNPWPVVLGVERRPVCRVYRLVRSDGFEALLAIGLVYQAVKRGRTLPRTSFHQIMEDTRRKPGSLFERDPEAVDGDEGAVPKPEPSQAWQTQDAENAENPQAVPEDEGSWNWDNSTQNVKANFNLKFDLKNFDLPDIAEFLNGIELPDFTKYLNDDGDVELGPGDIVDVLFGDSPIGQMIRNAPGEWRWSGEHGTSTQQCAQPEQVVDFDNLTNGQMVEWGGTGITYLQATTAEFEQAYAGAFAQVLSTAQVSGAVERRRSDERGELALRIAREG